MLANLITSYDFSWELHWEGTNPAWWTSAISIPLTCSGAVTSAQAVGMLKLPPQRTVSEVTLKAFACGLNGMCAPSAFLSLFLSPQTWESPMVFGKPPQFWGRNKWPALTPSDVFHHPVFPLLFYYWMFSVFTGTGSGLVTWHGNRWTVTSFCLLRMEILTTWLK